MKRNIQACVLMVMVAVSVISCSRHYGPEFAGRYHPQSQSIHHDKTIQDQTQYDQEESIALITTTNAPAELSINSEGTSQLYDEGISSKQTQFEEKVWKQNKAINEINHLQNSKGFSFFPSVKQDNLKERMLQNKDLVDRSVHLRDSELILYVILAILLPPLAVGLYEGGLTTNFWISVLLTLLFWLPGVIFALIVILGGE